MMRTLAMLSLSLITLPAAAQIKVDIGVSLPTIRFEVAPPLVEVQPGVQVVEDYDEEVFVVNRVYYVRRANVWYRAKDYRGGWRAIPAKAVPVAVVHVPPGQYRKVKGGHHRGHVEEKHKLRKEPPGHSKHRGHHRD